MRKDIDYLIWVKFKEKISSEWNEKYVQYGRNIDEPLNKIELAKAICRDVQLILDKSNKRTDAFAYQTLYGHFNKKDEQVKFTNINREKFIWYLGYDSIADFISKEEDEKEIKPKEKATDSGLLQKPIPNQKGTDQNWKLFIGAIFVLMLLAFIFFMQNQNRKIETLKEQMKKEADVVESGLKTEIMRQIQRANELEFKLYENVPDLRDTILLNQYFTKDGEAKFTIIDRLKRVKAKNWVLAKESSHSLSNTFFNAFYKNDTLIIAETNEYWEIIWQHKETGDVVGNPYKDQSHQTYHVIEESGKLKVSKNYN